MTRFLPWLVWMGAVIGSFAVMESRAIRRRDIPTLSEALAYLMGCHPRRRHGDVSVVVFTVFWAWLGVHVRRWETKEANES